MRKSVLRIPRYQQNLRHLLCRERVTLQFCSCSPLAEIAHEKSGLVKRPLTDILVAMFLSKLQGLFHEVFLRAEPSSARKDILQILGTFPGSSSFVSTARRLCARQPVQCIAMPAPFHGTTGGDILFSASCSSECF